MDIQVARFREVLELLKPVILRKPTLKVLTHVLIKDGKVVATDLETMVIVKVPEADFDCLIPYTDVVKMLQYVHGLEMLHIEQQDHRLTMTWSDGSSTFTTQDVNDFPAVPEFEPVAEAPIDIDTLIPAMNEAQGFAATETTRPVLNGVTLILGEEIVVAAGDGYRMAYKTLPLSFPQESTLVVPYSSVTALRLLWQKTPRTPPASDSLIPIILAKKQATVALDGKTGMRFVFGDSTTAIVKLVEGSPPVWLKLISKDEPVLRASLIGSKLELAVLRLLGVAEEGKGIVRLVFNEETVIVSARSDDRETETEVKVLVFKGAPGRIGLQAHYLLDYLKGKEGIVSLSLVSEQSPVAFNYQKGPTVLIMPMKVDWEGKAAEPAEEEVTEPAEEEVTEPAEEEVTEPTEEEAAEPAEEEPVVKQRRRGSRAKS